MNAIITGAGRQSGIGAAIAAALAEMGYNVYLTSYLQYDIQNGICRESLNKNSIPEEYLETKKRCETYGVKVLFKSFDLSSPSGSEKLFDDANKELGDIHVLVTSHCIHGFDKLGEIRDEFIESNFKINAKATFMLCQEFYRRFVGKIGNIITMSSTQCLEPLVNEISYAISKASTPIIVTTLAPMMAKKGIRINAINPGATEIGDTSDNVDLYKSNNSFGRIGNPSDVANLVSFLISEKGQWITGQIINSEGGLFRGISSF